jgi:GxxExxY protein
MGYTTRTEILDINKITEAIIGAAIEVHRHLGPGLLESAYQECMCEELGLRKIPFKRQILLPVIYKGKKLDVGYRIDLLVNDEVIVELKTVDAILPIHEAQTQRIKRLCALRVSAVKTRRTYGDKGFSPAIRRGRGRGNNNQMAQEGR